MPTIQKNPSMVTRPSLYPLINGHTMTHARPTNDLGNHPRPIDTTLTDMVGWFRQIGKIA
jgi:hypothetical protein